jgi:hypothetical protein
VGREPAAHDAGHVRHGHQPVLLPDHRPCDGHRARFGRRRCFFGDGGGLRGLGARSTGSRAFGIRRHGGVGLLCL